MRAYLYCAKAPQSCPHSRVPTRAALLAVLCLLFLVTAKASQIPSGGTSNPGAITAAPLSPVVRYEGRTETIRVPEVTEPWSATRLHTIPPQQKIVRFVGRFPGYEASKREANLRTRGTAPARAFAQKTAILGSSAPTSELLLIIRCGACHGPNGRPPNGEVNSPLPFQTAARYAAY